MPIESYQRIFALATSMFYAILTVIGLFYLPAVFAIYFPEYVGEALAGYCVVMIALCVSTVFAILCED